MNRLFRTAVSVAAVGLIIQIVRVFVLAVGVFNGPPATLNTEQCRFVGGVAAPEHIRIFGDVAFLSSDDREWSLATQTKGVPSEEALRLSKTQGALSTYRYLEVNAKPVPLTLKAYDFEDFHPLGFDVVQEHGTLYLLCSNLRRTGGYVSIFAIDLVAHTATLVREVATRRWLNGLVAISATEFYGTNVAANDLGTPGFALELLTLRRRGGVMRCVGYDLAPNGPEGSCTIVAEGILYSNGIAVNADHTEVYVAGTLDEAVHVYRRHRDGSLTLLRTIDGKGVHLDNLSVDPDTGVLYSAGGNNALRLFRHFADTTLDSGGYVVRIDAGEPGEARIIMSDAGALFSAPTCAAFCRGHILIGQLRRDGFVHCVDA